MELRERGKAKIAAWSERRMSNSKKKDKGEEKEKLDWVDMLERK